MPTFKSRWKSEGLPDEDLQALESLLMRDPSAHGVMKGTGGLRKARFAPPSRGKGKSGSMRVAYAQFPDYRIILLTFLFLKKDEENLGDSARHQLKRLLSDFADELKARDRS
jgi:hypothetical protein